MASNLFHTMSRQHSCCRPLLVKSICRSVSDDLDTKRSHSFPNPYPKRWLPCQAEIQFSNSMEHVQAPTRLQLSLFREDNFPARAPRITIVCEFSLPLKQPQQIRLYRYAF